MGVEVVVDGRGGAQVCANQAHIVEVLHIKDVSPGIHAALIELVVNEQVLVVFSQPTLVGVS